MNLQASLRQYWYRRKRGLDGYYLHVFGDLGVKVLKRKSQKAAVREYLLNVAASVSGLTSVPLALSLNEGRWYIWMKHIDGITLEQYAIELGRLEQPEASWETAFDIGSELPAFKPCLNKMHQICRLLEEVHNLRMSDHENHFGNFMISPDRVIVTAIDFSREEVDSDTFRMLVENHGEALQRTMVDEPYLTTLRRLNIVE